MEHLSTEGGLTGKGHPVALLHFQPLEVPRRAKATRGGGPLPHPATLRWQRQSRQTRKQQERAGRPLLATSSQALRPLLKAPPGSCSGIHGTSVAQLHCGFGHNQGVGVGELLLKIITPKAVSSQPNPVEGINLLQGHLHIFKTPPPEGQRTERRHTAPFQLQTPLSLPADSQESDH